MTPNPKNGKFYVDSRPRIVTIYELFTKLRPMIEDYPWAEDTLIDLWNMGAPDPSPDAQPCVERRCRLEEAGLHRCIPKLGCAMVRRVLLPEQFAKWWQDVAARQGLDLTAEGALSRPLALKFGAAPRGKKRG